YENIKTISIDEKETSSLRNHLEFYRSENHHCGFVFVHLYLIKADRLLSVVVHSQLLSIFFPIKDLLLSAHPTII
ncbi:MAG TPA: hypothetical protein VFV86_00075, partial [Nitrososphaeraceae archaeon]|nr:hypothetical protein [Nitrososphaeraceae archaeon]